MRLADFESLVRRLSADVPPAFFEGVAEVAVSRQSVPHPARAEIYTLGECIPLPAPESTPSGAIQSRIVLYHGSFVQLARLDPDFDWRQEAWETLTHELRHHVEWRARAPALEAYDRAAEENFARHEGDRFDPGFYLDGDSPVEGFYEVDGDFFFDQVVRAPPAVLEFGWHGARYRAPSPTALSLPAFLTVEGLTEPPPGDLVLVLRRKPRFTDLFRRAQPFVATVRAVPLPADPAHR